MFKNIIGTEPTTCPTEEPPVLACRITREACSMGGKHLEFEHIVAEHRDRVAVLAHRLLGWPADVDDVVQDVFMAALTNIHRFRGDAQVGTWLSAITVNICRKRHRRQKLVQKFFGWAQNQQLGADADSQEEPSHQADLVRRTLDQLPQKCREVLVLHYLAEMPVDRICQVLDLKRNAVEVRLSRARRSLKEQMELAMESAVRA